MQSHNGKMFFSFIINLKTTLNCRPSGQLISKVFPSKMASTRLELITRRLQALFEIYRLEPQTLGGQVTV